MISIEPLRRYPYFAGVSVESLNAVAAISVEGDIRADEVLFEENHKAEKLYILTSGRADVMFVLRNGEWRIVDTLVPGDLISWSTVVPPHKTTATVRARDDCRFIAIDGDNLRALCDERPDLGYHLMKQVARTLMSRLKGAQVQLATSA